MFPIINNGFLRHKQQTDLQWELEFEFDAVEGKVTDARKMATVNSGIF